MSLLGMSAVILVYDGSVLPSFIRCGSSCLQAVCMTSFFIDVSIACRLVQRRSYHKKEIVGVLEVFYNLSVSGIH